jgi:hypothetical protein
MVNYHPGRTAHLGQELRELAARKALEMQGPDRLITLPALTVILSLSIAVTVQSSLFPNRLVPARKFFVILSERVSNSQRDCLLGIYVEALRLT